MTLIQEATDMLAKMPIQNQQIVVDLLKVMCKSVEECNKQSIKTQTKRTGKASFDLPLDFDEHFDDMNDEIAKSFLGEVL